MLYKLKVTEFFKRTYFDRLVISFVIIAATGATSLGNDVLDLSDHESGADIPNTIKFDKVDSAPNLSEVNVKSELNNISEKEVTSVDTLSGKAESTISKSNKKNTPNKFRLKQNYPNPFNPATEIAYQLPASRHVELKVYDMLGRPVKTLVNESKKAGSYTVRFNAEGLSSGMYLYRLKAGNYEEIRKMILIK